MNYEKMAEEICEAIRMIVCLDTPPNITPEKAVSDALDGLFKQKDAEIEKLRKWLRWQRDEAREILIETGELRKLVKEFVECGPYRESYGDECLFCPAELSKPIKEHSETCPWRRAVEMTKEGK